MDNKERFFTACDLKEPDRVPYYDFFNEESIIKHGKELYREEAADFDGVEVGYNAPSFEVYDLLFRITRDLDIDCVMCAGIPGLLRIKGNEQYAKDGFGNVYFLSEEGEPVPVEGAVKDTSDLQKAAKARPETSDFRQLEHFVKNVSDRVVAYNLADTFKVSWRLLGGLEKLLPIYVTDKELAHKLARIGTEYLKVEIEMAVDAGAEILIQDGDLADTRSTFMSPKMFREFVKPYCVETTQVAHDKGVKIIKHSDGNVKAILEDLIEIGYDGFNPVEPQCMDIVEVKHQMAGRASVQGNIDCMYLLPFGTPDQVEETVKDTLKKVAPGGGYVCTSSNSIHPGCKPENTIAMIRAVQKYGKYPISID